MARITYRSRRPRSGGSSGPVSLIIVPRETESPASSALGDYVKQLNNQLTAARDKEALSALADGHTEAFINYAKQRIGAAADDNDRAYWQSLLEQATQKLDDDSLAADVNSGKVPLEDLQAHIQKRIDGLAGGRNDPKYPGLLKQLGDVQNSIIARDVRGEVLAAQEKLYNARGTAGETAAKENYKATLTKLLYRAKDKGAQDTIASELDKVNTSLEQDRQLERDRALAEKVQGYTDRTVSAAELQSYLAEHIQTASSTAEINRLVSLAQQVETNERTRASNAAGAASKAGQLAIDQALYDPKKNYLDAKAKLQAELDHGTPSLETVNIFKTFAAIYDETLAKVLPASKDINQAEGFQANRREVTTAVSELIKQGANKVVADAQKAVANYQTAVDAAKAGNGDAEEISSARFLMGQSLRDAMNSPLLVGQKDQLDTLRRDLETKVVRPQTEDIASTSALLAGQKKTKALETQLPGLYKNYESTAGTQNVSPKSLDDYARALAYANASSSDYSDEDRAWMEENLGGVLQGDRNKNDLRALSRYLGVPTDLRDLIDFARVRDAHNAEIDKATEEIVALTAGRGRDGSTKASISNLYATGGLLDESTRGREMASFQHPKAPPPDPYQTSAVEDPTSPEFAAALMRRSANGGAGSHSPSLLDEQQQDQGQDMGGSFTGADFLPPDARIAEMQTHFDAASSLQGDTQFNIPTWEIPTYPQEPLFDGIHFDEGPIDYSSFSLPPFMTSAIEDPNSPEAAAAAMANTPPPPSVSGGGGGSRYL